MLSSLLLAAALSLSAGAEGKAPEVDAATAKKAKDAFARGQQLYKQARYADAIAKFEETYSLRPHPIIYFNIGKCWEQLGETAKALRSYRDYLRLLPEAKDKDTVTDAIANLERRLKEKGLAQLMVYADPSEATIEVDGKSLGNSPASVELTAGNHKLSVRAEGYEPSERAFVMQTQRSTEITISLRKVGAQTPPVVMLEQPTPPPTPPPATVAVAGVDQSVPGQQPTRRFTWVAAGVTVAAVGAGVVLGVLANGAAAELKGSVHPGPDATALANKAGSLSLGANVAYGVAVAAGVTAVVLFFLEGRSKSPVAWLDASSNLAFVW